MAEELLEKITTETLLAKIPPETCWAMTAKTLTRFVVSRILKTSTPFLGKDDGILSLLSGWDKEIEIKGKVYGEGAKKLFPFVKETFNIPVDDAVGAVKLINVAEVLMSGPENEFEIAEATPEKTVYRITKCSWWERYKEFGTKPELIPCPAVCQEWGEEGVKIISHKLTHKLTKSMPRGEPFCERVIEFKEE